MAPIIAAAVGGKASAAFAVSGVAFDSREVGPGDLRHFSFSGGVAAYPECRSENELFLRADAMLYVAKQGGRNRICAEEAGLQCA